MVPGSRLEIFNGFLIKIFGRVGSGQKNNRLDLGGDWDHKFAIRIRGSLIQITIGNQEFFELIFLFTIVILTDNLE